MLPAPDSSVNLVRCVDHMANCAASVGCMGADARECEDKCTGCMVSVHTLTSTCLEHHYAVSLVTSMGCCRCNHSWTRANVVKRCEVVSCYHELPNSEIGLPQQIAT